MSPYSNWGSEDDEILIDFVRNHEAIFNTKSKDYRKTQLKQHWWHEIGEILNKTDTDCSKRWSYIRDYYIRRRSKPGTGSSGEAAKKRADLLSFLDSLPSSQSCSITNLDENSEDSNMIMEKDHDNSEDTKPNTQEIESFLCDNDNNNHKNDDKAKSDKRKHDAQHSQECPNLLKQIAHWNATQNELDENDLFFGSMIKIVKKLPPYEQVKLRLRIGSLVGDAELRHISNNSSQGSALSSRTSTSNRDSARQMERKRRALI